MKRPGLHGFGRFLLVAAIAALAALWTWTAPGDPGLARLKPGETPIPVYVLDNGFHSDLVLPRAALTAQPGPLTDAVMSLEPGDWILVGWGDAKFYVDQRPIAERLPDGARAFFAPGNASVLMLRPEAQHPEQGFLPEGRRVLQLSPAAVAAMRTRIENSLDLSRGAPFVAATRERSGPLLRQPRALFDPASVQSLAGRGASCGGPDDPPASHPDIGRNQP